MLLRREALAHWNETEQQTLTTSLSLRITGV